MESASMIEEMVARSRAAQRAIESWTQRQADAAVRAVAKAVYDNAEPLARMAVDETRMGVYEHKVAKNRGKARIIWMSLKNRQSVGVLSRDPVTGVTEVAKPMGVVAAVTPCTNPIVTPMCNAMFALKCRNSIIIAPHPRAKACARAVVDLFNKALAGLGAPEHLIEVIDEPTVELTNLLMKSADVVIATGGMGMVRAAYSSGKPSFGVGAGNVQCIVDRGMDPADVAAKVVAGRIFDNGIICSAEQTLIAHEDDFAALRAAFESEGTVFVTRENEKSRLREAIFPGGVVNKRLVGQPVSAVADAAGITIPEGTRMLLAMADGPGRADILSREKMCPVVAGYTYKTFKEAVDIAALNLEEEGKGHSVAIHSNDRARLGYAAERLPVSRLLVNQICATMNGGSFFNGFTPTTTLGCSSWGNNSISENLDFTHLMNITRIGEHRPDNPVPSDEEIWA
ncbi:MAG: aldehyde dehydrogenase family protein [Clostridiales bacterium]|nr:aldehyde dehydrogenase family protein [Clostridiales bacterium]